MERFLDYFKPSKYNLELYIFRQKELLQGTVTVDGEILGDVVKFHAVDLEIESVEFQALHWRGSDITPVRTCEYHYDGRTLEIPVDEIIQQDLAKVHKINSEEDYEDRRLATFAIKYQTKLNRNMQGCYLSTYQFEGQEQRLATTQFESHYAREAFPCIDEPAAKAVFNLALIVPDRTANDVVLANTPVSKQDINRFEFEPTPPMSTYLLAWVVGPLKCVSTTNHHGVRVASYAALNQPVESLFFANETAAKALDYFDDKFGIKYPLAKLDQVALPDFEAGAMENWGLVTYRESMMLADPAATLDTKQGVAITVTHELSHQWFGDLVTMAWWDDLWLNESFATIMEYYATDALYPEFNAWQDFYTGDCLAALRRDALPGVQSVKQAVNNPEEIATLFDSTIVYAKGARLILMLIHLMGEEKFYQGVHDYFEQYQYKNTVGDDLWKSLQSYADFDVMSFMNAWISQPGYPELEQKSDDWQQKRFLITDDSDDSDDSKWPLPEVKDDMSGHYLINLSDSEFAEKLQHFNDLTMEQKLRLLIDRMLLAKTTLIESASLLDLLPKFVDEESAAVWGIVSTIITDLKLFCPAESSADENFRAYLGRLLKPQFEKIDLQATKLETNELQLRDLSINIAYYARDEQTLHRLAELYQDNLSKIDPELLSSVLAVKMYFDEDEVFPKLLERYRTEHDPELKSTILFILASFVKNSQNIDTMIQLLEKSEIVRPQDHIFLYIYLLRNYRTRERTLDWLMEHWDYVVKLTGDKSVEDYLRSSASAVRTPETAQKFYNFFDAMCDNPILKRAIAMAHADIDARLRLIEHDTPAVEQKLRDLTQKGK